jgi:hypothetical protein
MNPSTLAGIGLAVDTALRILLGGHVLFETGTCG